MGMSFEKSFDLTYWVFGIGFSYIPKYAIEFELYLGPLYVSVAFIWGE